jgi:hypothetical protein
MSKCVKRAFGGRPRRVPVFAGTRMRRCREREEKSWMMLVYRPERNVAESGACEHTNCLVF